VAVATCPACGKENPDGFSFCGFCTAPLDAGAAETGLEERKVVSVLFCDLVGFTAASESADPEDVRARLRPYHELLRERIEAFGGTVEKFVGDAVMAVFGAPVSHEDDAERAVRAGLAILDSLSAMNEDDPALRLSVRVGINTGEALIALDARPEQGEGFATGDVVNTASRIQGAAPVDGIAVAESTYDATERVFEWERLEPVSLKGKAEPVGLWRPLQARARFGADVIRELSTPLVGRELELLQARTLFDRVTSEATVQLLTVVGEPGVGKSRLVAELFGYTDASPLLVTWRQGRCLPYGEGITFWALGEIVKAHAGVLESDPPDEARAKLERALPEGEDAPWLRERLLPLLGVESGPPVAREESFAAWRRFLESIADRGPAVFVFEDVHWADEALLAFLEHLADWAQGVPLLLVCTARPELYEKHPAWGAGLKNATTVNLAPLSDADTARLVSALLEQTVLPAETQQLLLERAGGNPLYAEEFVRMLRDRGLLDAHGRIRGDIDVAFPDSLHSLIAARLDTLPPDRKSLLQDAAVIGKVFWSGAVAAMGGRERADVEQALHDLARKELVRPFRRSSMDDEQELGFWHVLVRDVAYGQVPRPQRAAKHVKAAEWLEGKAGDRVEDIAEVLAYHTGEAIALADATGDTALAAQLGPAAARYALLAGERALGLDTAKALQSLQRSLELTAEDEPGYPAVLLLWASAAHQAGDFSGAADALERAADGFRERGDVEGRAEALETLSVVRHYLGDPRQLATAQEAVALLEPSSGPALVEALGRLAGSHLVRGERREAVAAADRALELAASLDLPLPARALGFRGAARSLLGEREGLEDMERAQLLLLQQGQGRDAVVTAFNRAALASDMQGPVAALAAFDDVIALAESRGIVELAIGTRGVRLDPLVESGRLEEALRIAEDVLPEVEAIGNHVELQGAKALMAGVRIERGEDDDARALAEQALRAARAMDNSVLFVRVATIVVRARVAVGDLDGARELLEEIAEAPEASDAGETIGYLPLLTRCGVATGSVALAEELCGRMVPWAPKSEAAVAASRASIAEAHGDVADAAVLFRDAAERLEAIGWGLEHAYAVLGRGRCLAVLGDPSAEQALRDARALFAGMGASPRVDECDELLARAARLTS
jgi:class 3 adenylate cyclase/tetratricopeptide (TPR) repeat protein